MVVSTSGGIGSGGGGNYIRIIVRRGSTLMGSQQWRIEWGGRIEVEDAGTGLGGGQYAEVCVEEEGDDGEKNGNGEAAGWQL